MRILIVYTSQSGNTKKVVDLVKEQLLSRGHNVIVKNVLTVTPEKVDEAELLVIGTPVHGFILFGQKPAKPVREFLNSQLPDDLSNKPVIGFATYLFFPSKALKPIEDAIKSRNGKLLDLITNKRSNKSILVSDILECISSL